MMIRAYLTTTALAALLLACGQPNDREAEGAAALDSLRVMGDEYPRAYFFRAAESPAKSPELSYEDWEQNFERLMGIQGKVLDEEIPNLSSRNIEFFTRFKERHPDQFVLLHFNGNARDPNWEADEFFAGHWIYFEGATVLSDVPAEAGETEIRVADASLFRTNIGRYGDRNEDIGICVIGPDGKLDWNQSEQVKLISADTKNNTIRVLRGQYGTPPRAFKGGEAHAAAHVQEGPWGQESNLMWYYNYSTRAPRDPQGRTCGDVLVADVVKRFVEGGELAAFDGVQFDVLNWEPWGHEEFGRGMDLDADGKADDGYSADARPWGGQRPALPNFRHDVLRYEGGVSYYGSGVIEFCRRLREEFPHEKLLLADGMLLRNQRAFQILNGIESEGFPHLWDMNAEDWSGGINRHMYWEKFAHAPVFNYVNHKFVAYNPDTDLPIRPDIPMGINRLCFAGSVMTNAAICYSYTPDPEPGEEIGIWDELKMGTDNKLAWLGKPLGPAAHLAALEADLLNGAWSAPDERLLSRLPGDDASFSIEGESVRVSGNASDRLQFSLRGVAVEGRDLFIRCKLRAAPRAGHPPEAARLLWVSTKSKPRDRFMSWVGSEDFEATFYFSGVGEGPLDIGFDIEGGEAMWISDLTIHAHPDAMYREFEHGVVLANPSPRSYEFHLAELLPGRSFRRIQGSSQQDPKTNDGSSVGSRLTLAAKDALFLAAAQ